MSKYKIFPGEYDCYVVNPIDGLTYSVISNKPVLGLPAGIVDGSACLHHAAFIDGNKVVWVLGVNANNISATGLTTPVLGATKTAVGNAMQVLTYANGGDPGGLGFGTAVLTTEGKVIFLGNTQSGFRGDGTEGNAAETAPYTVTLPEAIIKIAIGSYCFALGQSGKVYRWGGTRANFYWAQFSSGAGVANPDLIHIGIMNFTEPIKDIIGGADFSYAIGRSGKIYGWAKDTHFLGFANTASQLSYFDLSSSLKFPSPIQKMVVGPEATYALLTNGDLYAWGNNTQAAIGNGQEATITMETKTAPWGPAVNSLWQLTPVKVNPPGVAFSNIFTSLSAAFYAYTEDDTATLWVWGRNKGYVLWNGQGGTSAEQSALPNTWDVLSPTPIKAFGSIQITPSPNPCPNIVSVKTTITWSDGHTTTY